VAHAVPTWVAPGAEQVADCGALAAVVQAQYEFGVVTALRWITGMGPSPMIGEPGAATRAAAEAEYFLAGQVEMGESPQSATIPTATAQGVLRTLAWVLGWEIDPPVDLPRRPVPTADQLYGEAVAAEPWRYHLPEEQAAGRLAAQRQAARLARLAARADELAGQ
jgi:hypothetical protein